MLVQYVKVWKGYGGSVNAGNTQSLDKVNFPTGTFYLLYIKIFILENLLYNLMFI